MPRFRDEGDSTSQAYRSGLTTDALPWTHNFTCFPVFRHAGHSVKKESKIVLTRTLETTQPNKKPSSQTKVLVPGARILVADDFSAWRVAAPKIVEMCPTWKVIVEAGDGLEGVKKAIKPRPDVVLLDVGMPALNGIEAAKRIKQTSPASKIIFLAQDMDVELRVAALATGAEA
jgi:CheY-like chemotaxis protein